jgi:hypothetical protein
MWQIRRGGGPDRDLAARLRAARPEAPAGLVENIAAQVVDKERPRVWSRVAFAAAFSTLLIGSFAAFGGIGYTTAGASHAYQTARELTRAKPVRVHSAADAQYQPTPGNNVAANNAHQTAGAAAAQEQGQTLPFTGISLLGTVLVSLALIALGLVLRRRERRSA